MSYKTVKNLLLAVLFRMSASSFAGPPNAVIILVDDLGAESVGAYGNSGFFNTEY